MNDSNLETLNLSKYEYYISTLKNQLNSKNLQIKELTDKNNFLSNENNNLNCKISQLKYVEIENHSNTLKLNNAENKIHEQEIEIQELKNKLSSLSDDFRDYKSTEYKNYNSQIRKLQYQIESNSLKFENAIKIEKKNELLNKHIDELEKVLYNFNKEKEEKINSLEIDYNKRVGMVKRRMIDYLKSEHSGFENNIKKQNILNNKLTVLHVTELTRELEFQTEYMEKIIYQNGILKEKVNKLSNDVKILHEVACLLSEKNKVFEKQLQASSQNCNVEGDNNGTNEGTNEEKNKRIISNFVKKIKFNNVPKLIPYFNINSVNKDEKENTEGTENKEHIENKKSINSINSININEHEHRRSMKTYSEVSQKLIDIINKNMHQNSDSENLNNINQINSNDNILTSNSPIKTKELQLIKQLIKKEKEKENYKSQYETAKSKLDYLEKKYLNIFKLFDDALDKIYNDNLSSFKDVKDIYFNNDSFKSGILFNDMKPEEKYALICSIMKLILPLISENIINIEKINDKFSKIKAKFAFETPINFDRKKTIFSEHSYFYKINKQYNQNRDSNYHLSDISSNSTTKKSINTESNNINNICNGSKTLRPSNYSLRNRSKLYMYNGNRLNLSNNFNNKLFIKKI